MSVCFGWVYFIGHFSRRHMAIHVRGANGVAHTPWRRLLSRLSRRGRQKQHRANHPAQTWWFLGCRGATNPLQPRGRHDKTWSGPSSLQVVRKVAPTIRRLRELQPWHIPLHPTRTNVWTRNAGDRRSACRSLSAAKCTPLSRTIATPGMVNSRSTDSENIGAVHATNQAVFVRLQYANIRNVQRVHRLARIYTMDPG